MRSSIRLTSHSLDLVFEGHDLLTDALTVVIVFLSFLHALDDSGEEICFQVTFLAGIATGGSSGSAWASRHNI
jgi:hypothetical protein